MSVCSFKQEQWCQGFAWMTLIHFNFKRCSLSNSGEEKRCSSVQPSISTEDWRASILFCSTESSNFQQIAELFVKHCCLFLIWSNLLQNMSVSVKVWQDLKVLLATLFFSLPHPPTPILKCFARSFLQH